MDLDGENRVSEMFQAQCHLYKHMYHYIESMSLKCAVQLGIPDIIHKHDKPITLLELVSALNVPLTKANYLQRLMRMLVHSGIFATTKLHDNQGGEEDEEEGYVLTSSSRLLLKDSPTTLSPAVVAMLDPALISPWFTINDWFQGNDHDQVTPFESHHGMSFWDYGKRNPKFINNLNEAMACDSRLVSSVVKDHKEIFEGVDSLVDVGGGTGTLARTIADAYPDMKCTVLDLPQVVVNLQEKNNLKFVGGDMFKSIPSADAIIIKSVLHNWCDEDCKKILTRCREAIPSKDDGGKLILIEMVINDEKDELELTKTRLFVDMEMMLICNGRERNEKQWRSLFLEAGFSGYKITATSGINSIIEIYQNYPYTTMIGLENKDKQDWVHRIMQGNENDFNRAVSAISSETSLATYLASVSLTLSSLIGTWLGSSSSKNVFMSMRIYGDTKSYTIFIKSICLLTSFLIAFACFVQSSKHLVHANYLISSPDKKTTVKKIEFGVIRGNEFTLFGLRALYFALNMLLWFFGPIPMFVASIVMVITLYYHDFQTVSVHNAYCELDGQKGRTQIVQGSFSH